jgi:2-polyprenyl-3-methyl-5-hydroxy-6-metoxy-1,4-benzoquinol methylase
MSAPDRILIDGAYLTPAECRAHFATYRFSDHHLQVLDLIEGDTIVDAGCYVGFFVAEATRRFPEKTIIGIDYFPDNLRAAHLLFPELQASLRQMSVYALEFADDSIDCITFLDVIEHLEGAAAAVKEINRVLKPGGVLIVATPNPFFWRQMGMFFLFELRNSLYAAIGRKRRMVTQIFAANVEWNRHVYNWTPDTLLTLLVGNGFAYGEHRYERGRGIFERAFLRLFPFLGGTQIFKVRKTGPAPKGFI